VLGLDGSSSGYATITGIRMRRTIEIRSSRVLSLVGIARPNRVGRRIWMVGREIKLQGHDGMAKLLEKFGELDELDVPSTSPEP
jgi:hypothetical protein